MKEDFIIGFLSVAVLYIGFYIWSWLKTSFNINGILAFIIVFIFISISVGSISCFFDTSCNSLY